MPFVTSFPAFYLAFYDFHLFYHFKLDIAWTFLTELFMRIIAIIGIYVGRFRLFLPLSHLFLGLFLAIPF